MKLSTPWAAYARKVQALFLGDEEVTVTWVLKEDEKHVDVRVRNAAKAEALGYLLPCEVDFGAVKVAVNVTPENDENEEKPRAASLLRTAFAGNPVLERVTVVKGDAAKFGGTYAEFRFGGEQFWNGDLSNPKGRTTMLYQDLASEVLTGEGMGGVLITTIA